MPAWTPPDGPAYLELDEIGLALEHRLRGEPAAVRAARRDAERRWVRANPGPAFHGPAPVSPPSTRGLPAVKQRIECPGVSWLGRVRNTCRTHLGGLDQALHLEHMTLLWVRMVRVNGASPHMVWAALRRGA
ncbi:MAG: hypothetical protein ACT4QD_21655 [Acidobacteriota bacterium]